MTGAPTAAAPPLILADGLSKTYRLAGGETISALVEVSLACARGEAVGVVGESGSGKTTLGRLLLGLLVPDAGEVRFAGAPLRYSRRDRRRWRRLLQPIFQDPGASLNPRLRIGASLAEPLRAHGLGRGDAVEEQVRALLADVDLPAALAHRYPHELSGGERQRVAIARALGVEPAFVVADEPVSHLDVVAQGAVLELLAALRRRRGLAMLFIGHDLALISRVCDRLVVLLAGAVVETGPAATLLARPAHPYTRALAAAGALRGATCRPPLADGPPITAGCAFARRCPAASARCALEAPRLLPLAHGHEVACHGP